MRNSDLWELLLLLLLIFGVVYMVITATGLAIATVYWLTGPW